MVFSEAITWVTPTPSENGNSSRSLVLKLAHTSADENNPW